MPATARRLDVTSLSSSDVWTIVAEARAQRGSVVASWIRQSAGRLATWLSRFRTLRLYAAMRPRR